ncbi:EcsC family protein [Bacillus sp. CGMCC 1.16607]|uniref:EcsC family protein n=1 Tax=Bacillus sp. CGMCC 1.16607 TaxID=3351842 RepID=UPI003640C455
MLWTERDQKLKNELMEWENKLFDYQPNDFELTYEKYIERAFSLLPDDIQTQFFSLLDEWLFHLHAFIQGSQFQMDAKERILSFGRIFNPQIETITDLRELEIDQLTYIVRQQVSRHRLYSFVQGGLSGTGGTMLLGADLPAMAVINLRAVQLIAMSFGYEVNTPFEMMTSLKVFHIASLPPRLQMAGWQELKSELNDAHEYFFEGNEKLTDVSWVEQPIKQLFKGLAILAFRRKLLKGIPFVSIAIGAGSNYYLTKKVTDFAQHYYQMRYLLNKQENDLF